MAYGLKIDGEDTAGNEFYVIDSSTSSTEFLGIKTGGVYTSASNDNRASVAANTAFSNYSASSGNLLFARSPGDADDEDIWFSSHEIATAGSFVSGYKHRISDLGTTTNWTSIGASNNPSIGEEFTATGVGSGNGIAFLLRTTPIQAVKYLVLHPSSTLTSNINGSTYGLQVYNSASTPKVIFDSRKIINSVEIHKIYDKNSLDGGKWSSLTTAQKTATLVWDGSAATGTDQSVTEWKNTYASVLGSHYFAVEIDGSNYTHVRFGGYHFDNVNKQIYLIGYLESAYTGVGTTYYPYKNLVTVLVGELKQ